MQFCSAIFYSSFSFSPAKTALVLSASIGGPERFDGMIGLLAVVELPSLIWRSKDRQ